MGADSTIAGFAVASATMGAEAIKLGFASAILRAGRFAATGLRPDAGFVVTFFAALFAAGFVGALIVAACLLLAVFFVAAAGLLGFFLAAALLFVLVIGPRTLASARHQKQPL
jgi:hypothetical protein